MRLAFLSCLTLSLVLVPACGDDDGADPLAACAGKGGDDDDDDVCQADDNCPAAANPDQADADEDGLGDACDATPGACDDLGGDTDLDRVCNAGDNCPTVVNAGQEDFDHDGVGDACEGPPPICTEAGGDADGDQICQSADNCPAVANPDQQDADDDGLGDACDATPGRCDDLGGDTDLDTVCDVADNCPALPNLGQEDADHDGVGDRCDAPSTEPCSTAGGDVDQDTVCTGFDNCPLLANPDQADRDADGVGDLCDSETCDGLDNDGDGSLDEGFPDGDGDGRADCVDACVGPDVDTDGDGALDCDDPCPLDARDDADHDDVCGDLDNCPHVANPGQADGDDDGWGDACDIDAAGSCGPAAPLLAPGLTLPASLPITDVVAHPGQDTLYLSIAASNPTYGNSILAVDAPSRQILWTLFVGSAPGPLAISDDASTLYVGLAGAGSVRMVNVAQRRACLVFPLDLDVFNGQRRAGDMDVLPGSPQTLVVSTRFTGVSPDFAGVYVYDNGLARPKHTPGHTGARLISVASDHELYGYNNASTEYGLRRLVVDEAGLTQEWNFGDLVSGFASDILFVAGRIYATSGVVVNPVGPTLAGQFGASGPLAVAPEAGEVYFATSSEELAVFSTSTFLFVRHIPVAGASGELRKLVRWGAKGLAVVTTTGVVVLPGAVP